jgi:hypothetical protein
VSEVNTASIVHGISYPKCGRTWLRSLIGKYLADSFGLPEERILDTEWVTAEAGLAPLSFSHDGSQMSVGTPYQLLSEVMGDYSGARVLFMARDIRDTLVSAYFQATRRIRVFEGEIGDFLRSDRYGAQKILTFYQQWQLRRDHPAEFLLVRYEDLHSDPRDTVQKVLEFLGIKQVRMDLLERSIEFCSFQNLRKAEKQNKFGNKILAPKELADAESYKVRKGKVGNYSEYLQAAEIQHIDELADSFGNPFGLCGVGLP